VDHPEKKSDLKKKPPHRSAQRLGVAPNSGLLVSTKEGDDDLSGPLDMLRSLEDCWVPPTRVRTRSSTSRALVPKDTFSLHTSELKRGNEAFGVN
jgi:hypothetical protein